LNLIVVVDVVDVSVISPDSDVVDVWDEEMDTDANKPRSPS
jgi:hypothetical protein